MNGSRKSFIENFNGLHLMVVCGGKFIEFFSLVVIDYSLMKYILIFKSIRRLLKIAYIRIRPHYLYLHINYTEKRSLKFNQKNKSI